MVRASHQISILDKGNSSTPFFFPLILPQSITADDDKFLVQSVEPAAVNAGGVDIARSAPHTLLIQRDGHETYLMAVFLKLLLPLFPHLPSILFFSLYFRPFRR